MRRRPPTASGPPATAALEFYVWNGNDLVRSAGVRLRAHLGRPLAQRLRHLGRLNPRLFIDGASTGPGAHPSSTPIDYADQADGTATFGGYRGTCDLLFNGDIDQIMVFDKVLPIQQIWDRYGYILGYPSRG